MMDLDPERFQAHLASLRERGARWTVPPPSLVDDLRLAFAAGTGSPDAIAAFERDTLPAAAAALRALGDLGPVLDDCLQRVRIVLLVGRDDSHPRLLDYRAHGSLRSWVRIVALREYMATFRGRRDIALSDAVMASTPDAADDPELRYLRGEARDQLRQAVAEALAALTPRERALLRYSLIDDLGVEQIGAIYGVHKSSVSRWLAHARERLWEGARALLRPADDLEQITSLVRSLRSGLDLSLERLLDTAAI